jgi:hypothetical protein
MFRDNGVNTKAALSRRQAVIAPLSGQHRDEFAIAGKAGERFRGGPPGVAKKSAAQQRPHYAGHSRGNGFLREV